MRPLPLILTAVFLAACGGGLNARADSVALRLVQSDLDARAEALGLDDGDYRLTTDGLPVAGGHGGNGVSLALTPWDGDRDVLPLGLEYDYTFTLTEGDTDVEVEIVYKPTNEELREAVEKALERAEEQY